MTVIGIAKILELRPESLAITQRDELVKFVCDRLETMCKHLKRGDWQSALSMLVVSPAGDGHGCDNSCIDFSDTGLGDLQGGCDIFHVIEHLKGLDMIAQGKAERMK